MTSSGFTTLGRGQTVPLENYKKGAKVWVRHQETVWIGGELLEDVAFTSKSAKLRLDDEQVLDVALTTLEQLPFLQNPKILVGKDDLTELSFLHEPAVLHNLKFRFLNRHQIYTYCGIVLVAINPYADCSQIYGDEIIQVYRGAGREVRRRDPHIYAVAEEAFYDLAEFGKNQSIIVSGESGAGKTVSAKYALRYFASIASTKKGTMGIESRVLASNPIMEAIGNAKTVRNDNSSRFGKYVQINFGKNFAISGAEMKTYLLEKSRIVYQSQNERNYHIFYQICRSRDHPLLNEFHLGTCEQYFYTNQGGDSRIPGVDDHAEFSETVKALSDLGFTKEQQKDLMRTLVGILMLGNVDFQKDDDYTKVLESSEMDIKKLCSEFFEVSELELSTWLTHREIRTVGECVRKPLSGFEAVRTRDALAKLIYAQLFDWVVDQTNLALRGTQMARDPSFIGVLDIYGFETFDVNSFEQFCINYANEKLQQQFNQHVFKLEQEEYVREEIDWVRIEFSDNQPTIDLIEHIPGLISFLDEQCTMPRGSDKGWLDQISTNDKLKTNGQLKFPRIRSTSFIVKHFAADVSYEANGFMEKNKDAVNEQLLKVMTNSKFAFLADILAPAVPKTDAKGKISKKTVAGQFRNSLRDLMSVLGSTRPHYVRCIKPNDSKETFYFEPKRAIQQLRACGVLETVRISAEGFPSRWAYDEFARRYRVLYGDGSLGQKPLWKQNPRSFADHVCQKNLQEQKFALGKTKIFFRTGQVAILESKRTEVLSLSAIRIQSAWRGFVARRRFIALRQSSLVLQRAVRCYLARREVQKRREEKAAVAIQCHYRGYLARKKYQQTRKAVLGIQTLFRARQARLFVQKMRYEHAVLTIQSIWRGQLVRQKYTEDRRKIIKAQSYVRRWLAKRRLRELKIEARSVNHLQKLNTGLENKIIQLQQRLDSVTAEKNELLPLSATVAMLEAEIVKLRGQRNELHASQRRVQELELEVERLETDVDVKDAQNSELETKLSEMIFRSDMLIAEHGSAISKMQEKLDLEIAKNLDFEDRIKKAEVLAAEANAKRVQAEKDVATMKEQLLANANLLASPAFSREGSMRRNLPNDDAPPSSGDSGNEMDDLSLILRQQQTISDLRSLNDKYQREYELLRTLAGGKDLIASIESRNSQRAIDALRIQDLEQVNLRLKTDVDRFVSEMVQRGTERADIKPMVDRLFSENDRLREEASMLRSLISRTYDDSSNDSPRPDSGHGSDTHSESESTNVDSEMCMERQIRQLKMMVDELTAQLQKRNKEIESLERRLAEARPSDCSSADDSGRGGQSQIRYLASENAMLNNKLIRQGDELKEVRAKSYGGSGGSIVQALDHTADSDVIRLESLSKEGGEHSALLEVFNVPEFSRILVYDLKPRLARLLTKCFPSYILLAAFRYNDHAKDESALTGLFSTVHAMLKDRISNSSDLDILSMWLVNTWRLLNLLRQYSGDGGENGWGAENTEKQNAQRMQSFDVGPIREQLRARVEECYQSLMKKAIEPVLTPKIVPGVLQHESSDELGPRQQLIRQDSKDTKRRGLEELIDFLNFIYAKLSVYGADSVLLAQVFQQMIQWICSLALNHMMFRRELCNFEKAIQIKHNVTEIQSWLLSKGLGGHREGLEPLVQACHLLQSRKDESNLETLCGEMTNKLMPRQVVAILQHYTPGQDFEERSVDPEFLIVVQRRLNEREAAAGKLEEAKNTLIMPGTYLSPFDTKPYVYSDFALETLSLPSCLYLNQVSRLL